MAEAVVDDLEAVEVEEQDGGAALRVVALGAPDRLVQAVQEQHAVGEAGERVVERVVLQAALGLAAVGDVGDRADDPERAAVVVADGGGAGEHPAVVAVAVLDPVLELEVVVDGAGQVGVERLGERGTVVGVDAAEPLAARLADLDLAVAEHALPAGRVEDLVGGDVPVPHAVVGAAERERVALLGLGELLQRALMRDRVADRVLEPVGAEAGDEQEVGDAGLGGLLVGLAVGGVAEDDHGDVRAPAHQLLGEPEAVAPRRLDLAVDQHHVVVVQVFERLLERRDVLDLGVPEQRAHGRVARDVGAHGEHLQGVGERVRGHRVATPPPGRSAARRSPASRR